MKKRYKLAALLLAASLWCSGCSMAGRSLILANEHDLPGEISSVTALTSGRQPWQGADLGVIEGSQEEDEEVSAGSALMVNLDKGKVLYAKDAEEIRNPASITTLFTAYVILQNRQLSDPVTVKAEALTYLGGSSVIGLKEGDVLTVEQLLYGMLLCSGVDAANALAVDTAGSKADFVTMMNDAAKACGCVDTHFENANGLTERGHYSTAYDMYLILQKLTQDSRFMKIISSGTCQVTYQARDGQQKTEQFDSTVLYKQEGITQIGSFEIIGGKTGTTGWAGHCLALLGRDPSGDRLAVIVLKAQDQSSLYEQIEHIVKKNLN